MNQVIAGSNNAATMSSQEIAELTGKEHRNVMRDIRAMLTELHGEGGMLSFEHTLTNPQNGQTYPIFQLPKRESLILVSGYSVQMRAAIIDRWQELEANVGAGGIVIPQTLPDALRLAADLAEQKNKAEQRALQLTEEKAQIDARLAIAAPKAAALDMISADPNTMTMTEVSKLLGLKRNNLTARLHAEGWVYRQNGSWVAYETHIRNGCLQSMSRASA